MATDTPRDFKLGTDGDLDVSSGALELVRGTDAILQSIKCRLQFFKGECFWDRSAGIPYFEDVFVKSPDANVLQSVFRAALLETPGVLEIVDLSLSFDRATRRLSVAFNVSSDVGELDSEVTI